MADSELIDSIVSNEALGIRKSPSVFKIAFLIFVVLTAGFLAYSFFMKGKVDEVKTPLALGQPLNNPPQPITKPIETPVVQAPLEVNASTSQSINTNLPIPPTPSIDVKNPVVSVTNVAAPTQTVPLNLEVKPTVILPAPVSAPVTTNNQSKPNTALAQVNQVKKTELPVVAPTIALPETGVLTPPLDEKPEPVKHKKVVKKINKKEVKVIKTEDVNTPAIPMEEGVTREEIIVIQ